MAFWDRVEKTETCWLWQGCIDHDGYGKMTFHGEQIRAHRFSWALHNGPVPADLYVCHNCPGGDNRQCVNPSHLFVGTQRDNVYDYFVKNKGYVPHPLPPKGCGIGNHGQHAVGEKQHLAKLTAEKVMDIRQRYRAGNIILKELADEYGVTLQAVHYAIQRKTWKHIP